MRRLLLICAVLGLSAGSVTVGAQDLRVPHSVTAGDDAAIPTTGNGKATFYLLGPGVSRKSEVSLGEEIRLPGQDLRNAGDYVVLVCSDTCHSGTFYVIAAKPASLTFLVHPSRVPVGRGDAVSGVAFPFDQFHNLVLTPATVTFQLAAKDKSLFSKSIPTQNGVAWFRTASGKSAGLLQVNASVDDVSAKRAVQQVASDPCNLRITGQRLPAGIVVQTEPVHDCAGNVVPDGTIVTFSATETNGKSTVDAPIKQGIARAQIQASGATVVSVASGVVMGNELRIGAKP
jgi:hypothetical protein